MKKFLADLRAAVDRDPAAGNALGVMLTYPGFHAIFWHRIAHRLYHWRVPLLPGTIFRTTRSLTGIEIHPAAEIGEGFFIDHGTGVVIGETAIIGDDVTLFQGVTLGGTGKERGKRHPTLGDRVVVGAGAKILGDLTIGDDVYVGANAVVIRDVPNNSIVVGIPGRIVKREGRRVPSITLDHVHLPDPIARDLENLNREIKKIEMYIRRWKGDMQASFLDEGTEKDEPASEAESISEEGTTYGGDSVSEEKSVSEGESVTGDGTVSEDESVSKEEH